MNRLKYLMLVLCLIGSGVTMAQCFDAELIPIDGKPYQQNETYVAPIMFDWDSDGKQDLIVGGISGKFKFYKNHGDNQNPVFKDFEYIKAGDKEACVRYW